MYPFGYRPKQAAPRTDDEMLRQAHKLVYQVRRRSTSGGRAHRALDQVLELLAGALGDDVELAEDTGETAAAKEATELG